MAEAPALDLSRMAWRVLESMQAEPDRVRYETRVLDGAFQEGHVDILDMTYLDLERAGLVEPAPDLIFFVGKIRRLYRLIERGRRAGGGSGR